MTTVKPPPRIKPPGGMVLINDFWHKVGLRNMVFVWRNNSWVRANKKAQEVWDQLEVFDAGFSQKN